MKYSELRRKCPSCLRPKANDVDWDIIEEGDETAENLCWIEGQDKCYQIHLNMQEAAPDMVRLLERVLDVWTVDTRTYTEVADIVESLVPKIEALLSRAKGDAR